MGEEAAAIAFPVCVFGIGFVLCMIPTCFGRRRTRNVWTHTMREQSPYGGRIREWLANRLAEINKRMAQEELRDKGSQVWFSRYVHHGRLRHWVLIIDGTKYELKEEKDSDKFIFRIKKYRNWTVDMAKRNAALKEKYRPEVDGPRKKYICLIGWTSLPPSELKSMADKLYEEFGTDRLLWNNCQTILQDFSDAILHERALDWPWFREHTKTEFPQDEEPPPPPIEMTMEQHQLQQQVFRETHNQQLLHQLRHDLQVQQTVLQLQLQRDTGLSAAQMQMALSSALNPALTDPSSNNPALFSVPTPV